MERGPDFCADPKDIKMNIQTLDPEETRSNHDAHGPFVVPPPPPPAAEPEAPRTETTQHRSKKSVALHWLLMLAGFGAISLLGWLL